MNDVKPSALLGRTAFIAALMLPAMASAHPGLHGHTHGFANGLAHPFSGLDHFLAMTAVGLWAVQRGGKAIWMMPLAFISVMALGGMLGMAGFGQFPMIDQAIAASVLIMGIFIATATRMPAAPGIFIIGLFAMFHGYAHGAEMPATASGLMYGLGFVLATAILHALGISIGVAAQRMNAMKMVRAAGYIIAVCGIGLFFS